MERLAIVLHKIAKDYRLDPVQSYLGDLAKYLGSGDEKQMPRLLRITEQEMNRLSALAEAMPRPDKWSESDRRLVRFFIRRSSVLNGRDCGKEYGEPSDRLLGRYLEAHLQKEKPEEDFAEAIRAEAAALKIPEARWALMAARHFKPRAVNGRLTSAGRYLVALDAKDLIPLMTSIRYRCEETEFMPLFAQNAPERFAAVMDELIRLEMADAMPRGGWQAGLDADGARFESRAVAALGLMKDEEEQGELARTIEKHFPNKHSALTMPAASKVGAALGAEEQAAIARWLIERKGAGALPAIRDYIEHWNLNNACIADWKLAVLAEAVKLLGREARALFPLAMQEGLPHLRHGTLQMWIEMRDPADDAVLERQLGNELKTVNGDDLQLFIPLAASWNLSRMATQLGGILDHKSKPVRDTAAKALAKLGDGAIPKAKELLAAKKMDSRKTAIALLSAIATPAAIQVLQEHLARETSDDVRDLINKALPKGSPATATPAQSAAALKPDQKEVESLITKAAAKIKGLPAAWIDASKLPPLFFTNGQPLGEGGVRYLLYRQSREKEMRPEAEASVLYALLDRKRSGDFALAILNGYLGSELDAKERWALALAGILGDDRLVPLLSRKIDEWAEAARGKLAEYAVQALALLDSDAALLAVDAMAIRYRVKFKNIGKAASQAFAGAAETRGISAAELGDRVVPWLGFEPDQQRIFEFGANRIEVSVGLDLKAAWCDLVKGKALKSLPASAPDEIKIQAKELSTGLKEAAKSQLLRIENLMVQQHRWPVTRWRQLFLRHPLLIPFAVRLIWGVFNGEANGVVTFRALEDRSLTDANDDSVTVPTDGTIGIVHPLDLLPEARQAWLQHLADYNVTPPFAQLERPVVRVTAAQVNTRFGHDVEKVEINGMTFKGRSERLGWSRGSVCDAGCINYYYKTFPAAGVDVFLGVEGMYVGIDMYSDVTLGRIFFVKHRSVQIGSYLYDEPGDETDERLIRFGDVPAIAFSEAMGDAGKISGGLNAAAETAE